MTFPLHLIDIDYTLASPNYQRMTLVQLEYIVAVDTYKSFVAAAKHCGVAQPSLTMQIQKLERELDLELFNRSVLPIEVLPQAKQVLERARVALAASRDIYNIARVDVSDRNILNGKRAKNTSSGDASQLMMIIHKGI
jgi:hypothetical protein